MGEHTRGQRSQREEEDGRRRVRLLHQWSRFYCHLQTRAEMLVEDDVTVKEHHPMPTIQQL